MERHQRVHHPLEMGVCHRCTRHCRLMGPPGTFFLFTFCNNSTQRRALSTSGALLALIVGFTLSLAHYSFFLRFFVCKIESLMTIRLSPACLPSSSAPAGRPSTSRIWRRSLSPTSRKGASAIGFRWVLVSWFVSMTLFRFFAMELWQLNWHFYIYLMLGLRIFQLTSATSKRDLI